MAHFVRHEPCPNCGSKDNLARYSDGSAHCFGCKYNERSTISGLLSEPSQKLEDENEMRSFLKQLTIDFSPECVGWLGSYEIDVAMACSNAFKWHPGYQQLVFCWFDDENQEDLIAYQARNFHPEHRKKRKYFSKGNLEQLLPLYHRYDSLRSEHLFLVEDVVSAVKLGAFSDAMPCLSSGLSSNKLARVSRRYKKITVWLDSNMLHNANTMARQLENLGCSTTVVHTPQDPKEISFLTLEKTVKHLI
jgi:hypothetical protein